MSDDTPLFSAKQHALQKEFQTCPECDHELLIKNGKSGPFIGCTQYPTCHFTRPLHPETERFESKPIPNSQCPKCSKILAVKSGRYGLFIGCSDYPVCDHIEHEKQQQDEHEVSCPKCNKGQIQSRTSRYGKTFYACNNYPACKYLVNFKPIAQPCPDCDWPLLLEKKQRGKIQLICPQKSCGYKQKPAE